MKIIMSKYPEHIVKIRGVPCHSPTTRLCKTKVDVGSTALQVPLAVSMSGEHYPRQCKGQTEDWSNVKKRQTSRQKTYSKGHRRNLYVVFHCCCNLSCPHPTLTKRCGISIFSLLCTARLSFSNACYVERTDQVMPCRSDIN